LSQKQNVSPLLYILIAAVLWSTGGLFIKWTILPAFAVLFYRSCFALLVVAFVTRKQGFGLNKVTAVASVLYAALIVLFVTATKMTTAANAIFLQYTAPVYLLIFEPLIYKEKFRARDLVTVLVCLGGMTLFFVGKLRPEDVAGNILALASGVTFAAYFLLLRHPSSRLVNRASSAIYGNILVILLAFPWGLAALPGLTQHDALSVIYLGTIQIGLAYVLFTYAMAHGVRSLDAGIIGYAEPVLNPLWVFLVLGEKPSQWALLGGAIIIVAVIVHMFVDARAKRVSAEST
jgi:drug/metabolite transporter (DMT)-like permease